MDLFNLATIIAVAATKFALVIVLLLLTHTWTWLGRSFLLMFLLFGILYTLPLLYLAGVPLPLWTALIFRPLLVFDCVMTIVGLIRYDGWRERPDGVQWIKLLGLKRGKS